MDIVSFLRLKKCAIKVQSYRRRFLAQRKLALKRREAQINSVHRHAAKIQSVCRRRIQRHVFAKMLKQDRQEKLEKLRHDSAVKIQAIGRGRTKRQRYMGSWVHKIIGHIL